MKGLDLYRQTCPIGAGGLILRSWTGCEEPRTFSNGKVMKFTCRSWLNFDFCMGVFCAENLVKRLEKMFSFVNWVGLSHHVFVYIHILGRSPSQLQWTNRRYWQILKVSYPNDLPSDYWPSTKWFEKTFVFLVGDYVLDLYPPPRKT